MSNNGRDTSIDLDALRAQVAETQDTPPVKDEFEDETTEVVGGMDWMYKPSEPKVESKPNETVDVSEDVWEGTITKEDLINSVPEDDNISGFAVYNGPGLVINNEDLNKQNEQPPIDNSFLTPETRSSIDAYLAEMDANIERAEEKVNEIKAVQGKEASSVSNEDDEESEDNTNMTRDEFNAKYDEAVVVIDKTNFGQVINFTDEEHQKLERAKKIKLEEIENIQLETIKTKKVKKKVDLDKIIKRVTNINVTNIVLPASGYTAEISGCSAYELISLIDGNKNILLDAQQKWSLIHSKIENTSIGKMDFNEFLLNTASQDYNTFIYGLLCSTYPDDDKIPLTCEKCNTTFDHPYSVRSLIRAEAMSDGLKDNVIKIVDASVSEETAKRVHEAAPISQVKRIKLPVSGMVVEVYVQSAYDLINKSIKELSENTDSKYNTASIISTNIRTIYIEDTEEPGTYFEIDGAMDIVKTVYTLSEVDILVIRKIAEGLLEDSIIEYGFMNITCPKCKHYTPTINMELENILFYRYRQALNTTIE